MYHHDAKIGIRKFELVARTQLLSNSNSNLEKKYFTWTSIFILPSSTPFHTNLIKKKNNDKRFKHIHGNSNFELLKQQFFSIFYINFAHHGINFLFIKHWKEYKNMGLWQKFFFLYCYDKFTSEHSRKLLAALAQNTPTKITRSILILIKMIWL